TPARSRRPGWRSPVPVNVDPPPSPRCSCGLPQPRHQRIAAPLMHRVDSLPEYPLPNRLVRLFHALVNDRPVVLLPDEIVSRAGQPLAELLVAQEVDDLAGEG